MKHKVFKLFVDYEKEERWLNEMSAKGLQFSSYNLGNYVFEEGQPGEYTYRMEMMESHPRSGEGLAYIRFMEDAGVECVDTFWKWAYFRKKTADGPFDLFTDAPSRIAHYRRVASIAALGAVVNAGLVAYDIYLLHVNPGMLTLNIVFAIALGRLTWSFCRKIRKLQAEMQLRE
jgi:hypothetical protein